MSGQMLTTSITVYGWVVPRGTSSGVTFPVLNQQNQEVDVTNWTCQAMVLSEPDGFILHTFEGGNLTLSVTGVHLQFPVEVTNAITWKRGWFRVLLASPMYPAIVSKIVHGPVTVTDL